MAPTDGKDGAWASGIAFLRGIFGTWSWPKAQNTLKAALSFALCFAIVGVPPSEFVRKYIGAYPVYIVFTNLLIHPARTVGSMVEQFIVTIVFLILAAIVIFAAQASAYAFNVTIGGNIGGAIILAVWNFVFIAYGSWLRLVIPRWNNPLLTIVALIALSLTKESTSVTYSWRLVVDGVVPYVLGLTASLLVNVLLFPQTASNALKVSLRKSLGDIETAVKELTQCFTFNKPGNQKGVPEMAALVRTVRASLKTLSNTTLESSHELSYSEFSPSEIKVMTKSFWTMLTHLAAMESCIEIERTLVSDQDIAEAKKERSKAGGSHLDSFMNPMSESPSTDPDLTGGFASSGSGHTAGKAIDARTRVFQSVTDMPAVSALKQIGDKNVVIDFVLGPAGESIRALAGAASDSLSRISHFVLNDGTKQQRRGSVAHFVSGSATRPYPGESVTAYLDRMIDAFDQAQVEWMTSIAWDLRAPSRTLAQKKSLPLMTPTDVTKHYFSDDFDSDPFSTRAAHGGTSSDSNRTPYREEYFLASFFVFSLREFAQEVRNLAEKVERILNRRDAGYDPTEGTGSVRSVNIHMSGDSITIGKYWWIPDLRIDRWLRTGGDAGYQANFSTMPQGLPRRTFSSRLINFFVDVGASFQTHEVRFGIKFAVAFLILSWPTYVFPTEYSKVRGDSAMITLFVVLSPTVGGSLSTSIFRIFGTIAGAVFGFIVWRIAPGNPVVGSVGALVFSLPWWWVLFSAPAYARLGINALLTFGLVMIIAQTSIPPLSPDAFLNMALFTELMVVVGVIVALIVTAQVWPFLAGKELRLSISRTLQDLGFLYGKLVVTFFEGKDGTAIRAKHAHTPESPSDWAVKANLKAGSTSTADLGVYPMDSYPSSKPAKKVGDREKAVPAAPPESPEPSALHTVSLKRLVKKVRVALDTERELIQLALNEPHLSRKFPADLYTRVVESMVVLLDRMVSVAHILGSADDDGEIGRKKRRAKGLKDKRPSGVWSRHVVQQAIEPTRKTRQDMFAAVLLNIHILAGSLAAETPLPPFLPAVREARMRLVEEMRQLPFSLAQLQLASEYENVEEEEIETGNQIQVGKKPKVRTSNEFGTTLRRRKPRKDAERIDEYDDDEFDSELDDSDLDSMELSEERERRETANSEGRFIKIFGMRLYYGRRPRELLEEEEDEDSGDLFGIYSDSEDFDTEEGERYSSDQDSLADREDPRDSSFGAYGARSNDDEDHRLGQTWQSGGSLDSQHDMAPRGSLEIRADAPSYEVEGPASYDDAAIVPDSYQSDHHLLESQRGTPTKGNEPKLRRGGGTVKLAPRNTLLLESVEKVQDKRARRKRKADYIYFFAYAQAQQSIIEEIEMLAQLVRKIVGGIEMAPLMIPEDFMGGMGTTPGGGSSTSAFRRASTFVPPIPAPPPVAEITGRPGRRSSILSMRDDTNSTAYGAYRNRADMRSVIGGEAGINLRDVEVGMRDGFGRR